MLKFYIGMVAGITIGILSVVWAALIEDNLFYFMLNMLTLVPLYFGSMFLADRLDNLDDT